MPRWDHILEYGCHGRGDSGLYLMGFAFPLLCTFLMRACDGTKAPTLYFIQNGTKDAKCVGVIPTSHHLFKLLPYSLNRIGCVWLAGIPLAITRIYFEVKMSVIVRDRACHPMIVLRVDKDYYGSSQELAVHRSIRRGETVNPIASKDEKVFFTDPKVPKQHRILAYDRFGSPTYMKSSEVLPADLHIIEKFA